MIVCVDPEEYERESDKPDDQQLFYDFKGVREKAEAVWGRGSAKLMKEYKV